MHKKFQKKFARNPLHVESGLWSVDMHFKSTYFRQLSIYVANRSFIFTNFFTILTRVLKLR